MHPGAVGLLVLACVPPAFSQEGPASGRSAVETHVITPLGTTPPVDAPPSEAFVITERGSMDPSDSGPVHEAGSMTENDPLVSLGALVEVGGVRRNQLVGSGVVVGLAGTGDGSTASRRALANFIRHTGINVNPTEIASNNIALVSVTTDLGPFPAPDTSVDVQVQSIGDSTSLYGGVLLQTPLRGADGQVYVVAQGSVTVGGFAAGGDAASILRNHPTVGSVVDGGLVERGIPMTMIRKEHMELHLRHPSYRTAARVAERLNGIFPGTTRALNQRTIRIAVPESGLEDPVGFYASISQLLVRPATEAIVVVNERTGTLIAGHSVRVSRAAITQGNLTISVSESPVASQPAPLSDGETVVLPRTVVTAEESRIPVQVIGGGTTVVELATALERLGVPPRDLVSILLALERAGHLHARVEVL